MKIVICIPCMDDIKTRFVHCMTQLLLATKDKEYEVEVLYHPSSLIYDARNTLAKVAIQHGADYILWLDSDMVFEPDIIDKMLKSIGKKQFLSGLYFTRRLPAKPCIFKELDIEKDDKGGLMPIAENYHDYPKKEICEIAACGFGCVLMKASLMDAVIATYGLPFQPVAGFGEDLSFCYRVNQIDVKMYCDTSIVFGHLAETLVNEETYGCFREDEQKC